MKPIISHIEIRPNEKQTKKYKFSISVHYLFQTLFIISVITFYILKDVLIHSIQNVAI